MNTPRATMRLQLHREFTFADAARLVPYIRDLGVSHLYVSPIFTARPGSMHGYDVTDPTQVNPELGGEPGLRKLVAALHSADLGLVVDFVPNHMAAGGLENPWWGDVLRHGRASSYAHFFDIDWDSWDPVLNGKVLAPFLGEPYGDALQSGALTLERTDATVRYFDNRFPIRPEDLAEITAAPTDAYDPAVETGRDRLHRLLERQHYRLSWWRSAGDEINWRRFFDINGLAGLRIEDDEVFEATHATLLRLYHERLIDGVRIDHVDGLADPPGYCRRLRAQLGKRGWLVVEKILGAGERLPDDWGVDGTSGYDFMDAVNALLHDASGEVPLRKLWCSISGRSSDFAVEELAARREVLHRSFTAQLDASVAAFHRVARMRPETRDTSFAAIRRALVAVLTHFPVYRSYGSARNDPALTAAMEAARRECRSADQPVLSLLERWLRDPVHHDAQVRFQQLSAPLAAKAVEDTAFYRYGPLVSRNEVGADIARISVAPREFHAANLEQQRHFPHAMLATATHDHKRGEDLRARLAVLSEIPDEWEATVRRWMALNAPHRRLGDTPMPSPGDEAMLYQMIVGAWPTDQAGIDDYVERLAGWQLKALREAKLSTDWMEPNLEYEDAARSFLYAIMADRNGFFVEARAFAHRIGPAGAVNGLAQTLLKLTSPGVPDIYQGTEFWDLSLVDPDNRRPVDFSTRIATLHADRPLDELAASWRDGRVKQALIRRVLAVRHVSTEYQPLEVTGPMAEHVVAFARPSVTVVPRLSRKLMAGNDSIMLAASAWQGTMLHLPGSYRDVLTGARRQGAVAVGDVLARFPVVYLLPA